VPAALEWLIARSIEAHESRGHGHAGEPGRPASKATASRVGDRAAAHEPEHRGLLLAMGRQTSIAIIVALSAALWFALNFFQGLCWP
jgi:hypothetical protein